MEVIAQIDRFTFQRRLQASDAGFHGKVRRTGMGLERARAHSPQDGKAANARKSLLKLRIAGLEQVFSNLWENSEIPELAKNFSLDLGRAPSQLAPKLHGMKRFKILGVLQTSVL